MVKNIILPEVADEPRKNLPNQGRYEIYAEIRHIVKKKALEEFNKYNKEENFPSKALYNQKKNHVAKEALAGFLSDKRYDHSRAEHFEKAHPQVAAQIKRSFDKKIGLGIIGPNARKSHHYLTKRNGEFTEMENLRDEKIMPELIKLGYTKPRATTLIGEVKRLVREDEHEHRIIDEYGDLLAYPLFDGVMKKQYADLSDLRSNNRPLLEDLFELGKIQVAMDKAKGTVSRTSR